MLWTDWLARSVGRMEHDGGSMEVVLQSLDLEPRGMIVSNRTVVFMDWGNNSIQRFPSMC